MPAIFWTRQHAAIPNAAGLASAELAPAELAPLLAVEVAQPSTLDTEDEAALPVLPHDRPAEFTAASAAPPGRLSADLRQELIKVTGQGELDAGIDCAGAEEMIRTGFELLSIGGHYPSVGLVGDRIDIPLFPLVAREVHLPWLVLGQL